MTVRKLWGTVVAALVVGSVIAGPTAALPAHAADDWRSRADKAAGATAENSNQVFVRFKSSATAKDIRTVENKEDLEKQNDLDIANVEVYEVDEGDDPIKVAAALRKNSKVAFAEPDYDLAPTVTSISNDPAITELWGLHNQAQSIQGQIGINNIDVNVADAWTQSTGSGVVVAVLDEGIDISHPEFAGHIWTNDDCFFDSVDHDGNGYVNDCHGWDFAHNDNSVFDSADGDDHGTHVAGTIAALRNNSAGIAGVAPNVTIMPLKFLGPSGGSTSDAITAIEYARDNGARIVNCSWGGSGFSQTLRDTMASSGLLFTTASGNNGVNITATPQYPAAYDLPNQITVAAVDNRGVLASFSNYGGTTDVGAPGVGILSTIPRRLQSTIAVETDLSSGASAFWGFGLEDVVGATARRDLLNAELVRLGAISTSPIVVVDDDESNSSQNTAGFYTAALTSAGYTNVSTIVVTKDANGPSAATLAGKIVIWETGYAVGSSIVYTLTNTDQSQLTTFLNGGGKLLVAGSDAIWRNEQSVFVRNFLGVEYLGEGDTRTAVSGHASTPYAGMTLNLSGTESPTGTFNPYHDVIAAYDNDSEEVLSLNADPNHNLAYGYKSGTSMAAPHVAGIAALVGQVLPAADAPTIAYFVKAGVRPLASLSGTKTRTGGMVDAANSVALAVGAANPPDDGYRFVASDGGIFAYGNAGFYGSTGGQALNQPIVGMATTPDSGGYWLVARDGGIFGYGGAQFKGSTGSIKLNQPIVGMSATPTGNGYWLVASDGGIFAYGDSQFYGSTGSIKLNKPIVGMATTPSGGGYWLVASDGGIFAYGDAQFYGSTGSINLNKPIVGMAATPSGGGYWLVASDGGIFAYGDAQFYGSPGGSPLNKPVVSIARTGDGGGYWLTASDGGVFAYGNAGFYGSTGSIKLNQPIVAIAH